MVEKNVFRKSLVVGIIALFVGASIITCTSRNNNNNDNNSNLNKKFKPNSLASFDPFEEDWLYRKEITINHTFVDDDLHNFPALINTIDTDLRDKAQDDGDDILFMDDIGIANQLNHEIEYYNNISGELVAWVNITTISSNVDTSLYMYYGNQLCNNQQNIEDTWDSGFNWVLHFNEGGTGMRYDSTNWSRDMSPYSYDGDETTSGNIDGADKQTYAEKESLRRTSTKMLYDDEGTIEAYIKATGNMSDQHFIVAQSHHNVGGGVLDGGMVNMAFGHPTYGGRVYSGLHGIDSVRTDNVEITTNNWYYIVFRCISNSVVEIIINKQSKPATVYEGDGKFWFGNMTQTPQYLRVGNLFYGTIYEPDGSGHFEGIFDEVRHSKIPRSNAWINATYDTMTNQSFLTIGSEYNPPPVANFTWTPEFPETTEQVIFDASDSYDPNGFIELYEWDWGNDGEYDDFSPSPIINHSWSQGGNYLVKLRVRDNLNITSNVTKTIHVGVGITSVEEINGGFRVSAIIKNIGNGTANNINWSIDLSGGIIILGRYTEGVITSLAPDETKTVRQTILFGIGKDVVITVSADGSSKQVVAKWVLGPLVLGVT